MYEPNTLKYHCYNELQLTNVWPLVVVVRPPKAHKSFALPKCSVTWLNITARKRSSPVNIDTVSMVNIYTYGFNMCSCLTLSLLFIICTCKCHLNMKNAKHNTYYGIDFPILRFILLVSIQYGLRSLEIGKRI